MPRRTNATPLVERVEVSVSEIATALGRERKRMRRQLLASGCPISQTSGERGWCYVLIDDLRIHAPGVYESLALAAD